jgi:glucose/arabinose dehydrogenase
VLALLGVLVLALAAPASAGTPAAGYTDTLVAGGLAEPTAIAFLPDGRLLVTEKGGFSGSRNAAVKLVDGVGTSTLGTIPVCAGNEMGLLGVAVDAEFAANGFVYLYRTESAGGCVGAAGRSNQVVRVTTDGSSLAALTVLLNGIRTDNGNHDGGVLRYNPTDGKLYVGVGDTGRGDNIGCPGSSTNPYAQDLGALEGKILRLDLDGGVPADNPFVGQPGARGEVFAAGFRNPFRFSFDPATGSLWVGDVGDLTVEEIDVVGAGENHGWPRCEGTAPAGCAEPGDSAPVFVYAHSADCGGTPPFLGASVTGGSFAGEAFGDEAGHYVFGDYSSNTLYRLVPNASRDGVVGGATVIATDAAGPVDFVTGPDGAVYYVSINAGEVRRLGRTGITTTSTSSTTSTTLAVTAEQLLEGGRLALARRRLSVVSKDPNLALGAADAMADPTVFGATLRVRTGAGCVAGACDATYGLPRTGWRALGAAGAARGYRFRSRTGPLRLVVVKAGRVLKAVGKGAALTHDVAADPAPVDVALQTGARRYCLRFGGVTKYRRGARFVARGAPVAPGCPP